jgi:hypothetical protein
MEVKSALFVVGAKMGSLVFGVVKKGVGWREVYQGWTGVLEEGSHLSSI